MQLDIYLGLKFCRLHLSSVDDKNVAFDDPLKRGISRATTDASSLSNNGSEEAGTCNNPHPET